MVSKMMSSLIEEVADMTRTLHDWAQAYDPQDNGIDPSTFWASVRLIEEHERAKADPSEREAYEGPAADNARRLGTLVSLHDWAVIASDHYFSRPKDAPRWWREWHKAQDGSAHAPESDELRRLADVPSGIARAASQYRPDARLVGYREELRGMNPLSLWIVGEERATVAAAWLADVRHSLFIDVPLLIAQMEGLNRYGEGGSQSVANKLITPSLLVLDRPDLATWNAPTVAALLPVMRSRRNKGLPTIYTSAIPHATFARERLHVQARSEEQRSTAEELYRNIRATLGKTEAERTNHEISLLPEQRALFGVASNLDQAS